MNHVFFFSLPLIYDPFFIMYLYLYQFIVQYTHVNYLSVCKVQVEPLGGKALDYHGMF